MARSRLGTTVATVIVMVVFLAIARDARAQTADTLDLDYCLGFSFSTWTPPLDLKQAGHDPSVDTSRFLRAPHGRDWATSGTKAEGDTTIVLFPIWWPPGVVISLEHVPASNTDTVRGKAMALVADARAKSPTTNIRAWQKRCGG
jgi:hypothetical protein